MSRGWLIVFAKAPRPGLVKTRMSPPLTMDQAADLYRAMLRDVLSASGRFARDLDLEPVVAFYPPESSEELIPLAPTGFRFQAQQGADLGERMAFAVREAAAAGAERILIRGSDSPALPFSCVRDAMDRLDDGDDVVFTPDQGGGYALVGLRRSIPQIFDPPMSTTEVLDQTLTFAVHSSLRASTTGATFDLDTFEDFHQLKEVSEKEKSNLCPETVQFIAASQFDVVL